MHQLDEAGAIEEVISQELVFLSDFFFFKSET